jgi:hypothetical protein
MARNNRKAVPEPPKGKETQEQKLIRTRGYGLGKPDPKTRGQEPGHTASLRNRSWKSWGRTVRAGTPIVGMRFEHF